MLKLSTTRNLVVFMTDSTDHVTGKTGLTLTITASKDGGAFGSITPVVTELATGWYSLALTTTHTNTLGYLALHITSTGADPTDLREEVVTDLPGASVSSIATGGIAAASFAAGAIDATAIADNAIDRATFATETGLRTARSNTAQAGAAGTVTLDASASAVTDFYVGLFVTLTSGTGAGQVRVITAYNGSTKVATIAPNWATTPDNTSTFALLHTANSTGVQGNVTGSVGSVTGNVGGNVVGSVASVTARVSANTDQLAGQTVTAAAGVTFPTSVASPTNITAGTITTVTNLTNAATAGDLTATMKTSVTTAATAATPTAAAVTGNVGGNVVGSVGSVASGGITSSSFAASAINAAAIAADAITAAKIADGAIDAATFAAGAINAAAIAADAITDAKVASDVTIASVTGSVGSVTGAVGSVTGAVGSVTGNVGGNVVGSVASVTARVTANADQLAGQTVTAAAGVTFPSSVASPTNITAGVITTVTNLTNAATAGDLTAAMKASVNAEADTALSDVGVTTTVTGRIDAAITSRLAAGSYTAPDNTSITAIKAKTDNLPVDPADASDIAAATTAISDFLTALGLQFDTVKAVTDKLNDMVEADSSPANYRLTAHALANAPTGGGTAPTAAAIADAVWDEAIAGHAGAGSTGLALANAGSAGNPWATVITGAYTAEQLLRVLVAVAAGRSFVTAQGGGNAEVEFRDVGDNSVIVQAAMQNSNRNAVTLTP